MDNAVLFNDGWRFALTDDINAPEELFKPVQLPHDWQIQNPQDPSMAGGANQGFYPRNQVGVYRLDFIAPKAWQGKCVSVVFDGVQRFSDIYLNGRRIGGRKYGYVPIEVRLDDLKYEDTNRLCVRADNTIGKDLNCGGGDRWYSGAGIYRNVFLIVNEPAHIKTYGIYAAAQPVFKGPNGDLPDTVGITCAYADVHAEIESEGGYGASLKISVKYEGEELYTDTQMLEAINKFDFKLEKPHLWQPNSPCMYRLEAEITKPGQETSCASVDFGVRSAVFDEEDGFILNGLKTKLWGANFHHDAPAFGAAVPIEIWERRLKSIKALGMNAVRCSHNPQAAEFYTLCDKMGLLVIDEYCDKWQNSNMYFDLIDDDERLEELDIMLKRDRNHPSIILWSVGNEVVGQYSEYYYATLKKLCARVRELDKTRAVSCALIGFVLNGYNDVAPLGKRLAAVRRYAEIVDVFMGNYMEQFYAKLRESGMRKPIIGSEVFTYYCYNEKTMNVADISGKNPYAIVKKYPWVCGAFVWAGCDYLGESIGWPARGWTGALLDSTAENKLRAYFCASQLKTEPVLKLAVYDESEPWDMARGMWGFPQMRSHWKYNHREKVMHVAAMTNCDTVKLYQNSQTVRTGCLKDNKDGMIHFYLPFISGMLRAEGYMNGRLVAEHTLYSDYKGEELSLIAEKTTLPADGKSIAITDLYLLDAHGEKYTLEDLPVKTEYSGAGSIAGFDNGNAICPSEFGKPVIYNGHLQIYIKSPAKPGTGVLNVSLDGLEDKQIEFKYE